MKSALLTVLSAPELSAPVLSPKIMLFHAVCRFFIVLLVIGYYSNTIYVDSTGADSSGAENTVSIALFTHSFPRSGPKN